MLHKQFLKYFQNIGFVAPGFEASKFLNKCEPPLWSIVNCRKLQFTIDLYGLQYLHTNLDPSNPGATKPTF